MREIASSQIAAAQAAAAGEPSGGRTALLEARRRTKKLRGLLKLVRADFGPFATENMALRDAAAPLSALRDDEVLRQTVEALRLETPDPALARIAATLSRESRLPHDLAAPLAAFDAQMAAIAARLPFWTLESEGNPVLFRGLARGYRDCRRTMRRAAAHPDDTTLHDWRKALKTHAFHLMLLRKAAPEAMAARHGLVDRLGDLLGLHHDICNLIAHAKTETDRFGTAEDVARLSEIGTARLAQITRAAMALGRQVLAEKPRAFRKRIRANWESIKLVPTDEREPA